MASYIRKGQSNDLFSVHLIYNIIILSNEDNGRMMSVDVTKGVIERNLKREGGHTVVGHSCTGMCTCAIKF